MKKHECELCFRNFSNGRALGGHMRSHMMNFPLPPTSVKSPPPHISEGVVSASSSSSSEDEGGGEKSLSYGMRKNPIRSIRIVDLEMEFAVDAELVVLQDRESETESSKNPTRRRSRRIIANSVALEEDHRDTMKKSRTLINPTSKAESFAEPEPASSVSDDTEEDVAFCLMMLSRDKWKRQRDQVEEENDNVDHDYDEKVEEVDEDDEAVRSFESSENSEGRKPTKHRVRGKYKCETCNKVFRSYQALGGHRARDKNTKLCATAKKKELEKGNSVTSVSMAEKKTHECPVCFRIFSSGQALGGHKRIHVICTSATSEPIGSSTKFEDSLIDLNLPALMEDDEVSQIELSAVSDAEFPNPIRPMKRENKKESIFVSGYSAELV